MKTDMAALPPAERVQLRKITAALVAGYDAAAKRGRSQKQRQAQIIAVILCPAPKTPKSSTPPAAKPSAPSRPPSLLIQVNRRLPKDLWRSATALPPAHRVGTHRVKTHRVGTLRVETLRVETLRRCNRLLRQADAREGGGADSFMAAVRERGILLYHRDGSPLNRLLSPAQTTEQAAERALLQLRRQIFALEEPTDDLSALGELLRSLGWIEEEAPQGIHLLGRTVEARAEVIRGIFRRMVALLPHPPASAAPEKSRRRPS